MSTTHVRWGVLGFLFLISVVTYLDRVNIAIAGVSIAKEYQLTRVQLGTIFSSFVLGYALFQIPGGWLGDRFGKKKILTLAIIWWSIFTSLTAWAGKGFLVSFIGLLPAFCLVRFLIGVGEAAAYPCANALAGLWFPSSERARATGVIFGGVGFGSAITPVVIAWLMLNFGWEAAFYISGIVGIVLAIFFYLYVTERPQDHPGISESELAHILGREVSRVGPAHRGSQREKTPWKRIFGNGQVWLLTASYFLTGYVGYVYFSWFYLYLVDVRGFSLLRGSFIASLPFIAMTIGSPLGGWLSDRWIPSLGKVRARRLVAMGGLIPAGLLLYLGSSAGSAFWAITALSTAAGLVTLTLSSFWATAIEIMPSHSATVSAVMNMGTNLGGVLSPILTPWIAVRYGWIAALSVAAGASLGAAVLWNFIGKPESAFSEPVDEAAPHSLGQVASDKGVF